ncbi:MAG: hypothetical protein Q7R49_05355 [Candidatus Daviesbacteria bacterium]|nr:hypothetical protein [Candidatus Daviesbacteria bacterium]
MTAEIRINGRSVVSDLPEESGIYSTPMGNIGIELRVGQEREVQEVILDCTDCQTLQGKRGKERRVINLGPNGIGSQQISSSELLEYDLGRRIRPKYLPVLREVTNKYWWETRTSMRWMAGPEIWDR